MDVSSPVRQNTPVQTQLIDSLPDTGSGLFYGTGTTGPKAAHPNLPYENVGLNALNGDLLTLTGIRTSTGSYDNVVSFSRKDPTATSPTSSSTSSSASGSTSSGYVGQETLMEDHGSTDYPFHEFTLLDNNKKFILDNTGNISRKNDSGPDTALGNLKDTNILSELESGGMSSQGANDLVTAGQDGSIFGIGQIHQDFSKNDLKELKLSNQYAETQSNSTSSASPGSMEHFAGLIQGLLNF